MIVNIANELFKYYNANQLELKFTNDKTLLGNFDFDNNIVYVNPNYNKEEITITILHEIKHLLQKKSIGKSKFIHNCEIELSNGKDQKSVSYEIEAEKWANSEYNKIWKNKLFGEK